MYKGVCMGVWAGESRSQKFVPKVPSECEKPSVTVCAYGTRGFHSKGEREKKTGYGEALLLVEAGAVKKGQT